jgi:hypothetical protein
MAETVQYSALAGVVVAIVLTLIEIIKGLLTRYVFKNHIKSAMSKDEIIKLLANDFHLVDVHPTLSRIEVSLQKINDNLKVLNKSIESGFADIKSILNTRFDRLESILNSRFDKLEGVLNSRFDRLEGKLEQVEERLGNRIGQLEDRLMSRLTKIEDKLK